MLKVYAHVGVRGVNVQFRVRVKMCPCHILVGSILDLATAESVRPVRRIGQYMGAFGRSAGPHSALSDWQDPFVT